MPARNYTSPGSYSDRLPFATRNVLIRCVGGGASGYRDCDGDEEGGGGGGGGFAQSSFVRNGSGFSYTVGVANGGGSPGCDSGQNGTASRLNGGGYNVRATGGRTGNDDSGGGGGEQSPRHITGQQLCEACRLYAIEQYGYLSKMVLANWGIHSTSDFGEIVYNLIRI